MKVGDLVTLSAYGLRIAPMWNWKREYAEGKQVVGVVVAIKENPFTYSWTSKNERLRYYVQWCGDGPTSRDNGSSIKRTSIGVPNHGYFLRKDLRFVK